MRRGPWHDSLSAVRDIIITVPSRIGWSTLEKEFAACEDYTQSKLFRVPRLPTSTVVGARCFVVHKGVVKGSIQIAGVVPHKRFKCTTTGTVYEGTFVECSGPFFPLKQRIEMRGFQGWRYFDLKQYTAL